MYLCVTPERVFKTKRLMDALKAGWGEPCEIVTGAPPDDGKPFIVWGQRWLGERLIPEAIRTGRPFWHIDNGFWNSARGGIVGNYRLSYRGMSPILLDKPVAKRAKGVDLKPWKTGSDYVLLAYPSMTYGRCLGLDMAKWCLDTAQKLQGCGYPVKRREKDCPRPLEQDLAGAVCLVTHSSNVAVEAVIAGVPVVVEPTCAAAPVGSASVHDLNRPDRDQWLASLACQQFTLGEMASGEAYRMMKKIAAQVDKGSGVMGSGKAYAERLCERVEPRHSVAVNALIDSFPVET